MISLDEFFKFLIKNPEAKLHKFQRNVTTSLLQGNNVILSAPTGAGKTWAALMAYLKSKMAGEPVVDKVIYVLPLRSLASSLYQSTSEVCGKLKDINVTIQTGDQQDDMYFQGDICFTTIDQFLAGYLNLPMSLSKGMANINAGSYIGSLVIFDEVHLLDPQKSFATVLEMVKRLKPYTRFLFMTATLSSETIKVLQKHLNADVINVSDNELNSMPSHKDKKREYRWVPEPLTIEHILGHHQTSRTIVVCNTVGRAQEIYQGLKNDCPKGCKLILLHSRFFPEDRKSKEAVLNSFYGPEAEESNVILVTTQVVEAGLDISAVNLHTELCPANSLLQRAGRCARYAKPRNVGIVWVYELEQSVNGRYKLGPYRGEYADLVEKTREEINKTNGCCLSFSDEKKLVDCVHNSEVEAISQVCKAIKGWQKRVSEAIDTGELALVWELIRDVDSVNILLTDNPNDVELERHPRLLSVPRTSLFALTKGLDLEKTHDLGWYPVANDQEAPGLGFAWQPFTDLHELSRFWLIALPSTVASYSSEIGLCLGQPGTIVPISYREKGEMKRFSYEAETYFEHVQNVLRYNQKQVNNYRNAVEKLERYLKLSSGFINQLSDVVCALHDSGKLSRDWQNGIWNWQNDFYPNEASALVGQPLAHSTFNPANGDYKKQLAKRYCRGTHAAEGAFIVVNGLLEWLLNEVGDEDLAEALRRVCTSAIARHHSARLEKVGNYQLTDDAVLWVSKSLEPLGIEQYFKTLAVLKGEGDKEQFKQLLITAVSDRKWLPLYWLLVRRLRLADQGSFNK